MNMDNYFSRYFRLSYQSIAQKFECVRVSIWIMLSSYIKAYHNTLLDKNAVQKQVKS